jgi:hypothetical protein
VEGSPQKAAANLCRHSVALEEAAIALGDPLPPTRPVPDATDVFPDSEAVNRALAGTIKEWSQASGA